MRSKIRLSSLLITTAIPLIFLQAACSSGFEPFNKIDKLRLLAIKASPPALLPGQTSILEPLVWQPNDTPIQFHWSWCPITLGSAGSYECALDESAIRKAMEESFPGSSLLLPSFDLGNGETATFMYSIPKAALEALCSGDLADKVPDLIPLSDCDSQLIVTVKLEMSTSVESVTAVKELTLLLDENASPNRNPELGEVSAGIEGKTDSPLDEGLDNPVIESTKYRLNVMVPEDSAENFTPFPKGDDPSPEPRKESLFLTWFVTGGETEFKRTTFIDGEIDFDKIRWNSWTTPKYRETADGAAEIFFVIQDERGGVGWTTRSFDIIEEN